MFLIGIGANLPSPGGASALDTCRRTAIALDELAGYRLRALSRWYLTEPQPPSGQPPYVNAVADLIRTTGTGDPAELLAALHRIEANAGRVRGERNAARTLDLDIIAIDQIVRRAPDPVLPHPRAHERAFVLAPLIDVAPGWVHPVLGRSAEDLLRTLPPQGIRIL